MIKVAIDKNSVKALGKYFEYIYLFKDEPLEELLKLNIHCIKYDKYNDTVDINLTKYKIDSLKDTTLEDKEWYKLPEFINNKIAIIIPNYNYEEWLDKCLYSIVNQTYKNYEVIFIDDMSTDGSVNKAYTFVDKLTNIKIVELKQKRYNGGARNEAYLYISDDVDYVYYIDSDDWLYTNTALEDINKKLQKKPDVLFVGMAVYKNNKYSINFIPEYKSKYEAFEGWSGSCGKVIKKSLATRQECLYNEGTLKEDRNQHRKICYYMKTFELLKKPIYVWNQSNSKSVTTIRSKNPLWETSTIRHYADLKEFYLKIKGQDNRIDILIKNALNKCLNEIKQGGNKQW